MWHCRIFQRRKWNFRQMLEALKHPGLQMKKLILSVEAGAITLTDSEAAELEADAEAGAIRFSGSITDRVDADAELGNIVLKLSQSKDEF
mgnify:CR=1 FL=1